MRDDQTVAGFDKITDKIFSIKDMTAIVTGAGSGMGRAIALGMAEMGANIAVFDMNTEAIKNVLTELEAKGIKAKGYAVDISKEEQIQSAVDKVHADFERIDILVNNAGIGSDSSFPEVKNETWDKVLNINLNGTMHCSKAVCTYMIKAQKGSIINIGSSLSSRAAVLNCLGGSPEYCVSKAGVQALTRSMAQFLAKDGIRVNALAPGPVDSPMHKHRRRGLVSELPRVPLGRIQNCDDIVGSVVFLASEASRFITGQTIHVNGGMLMID